MAAPSDEFLAEETLAKGIEFKLGEEGLDFLIVPPLQSKILDRGVNWDVSYDGGKLAGESCLVSVLNDALLELAFKRIRIFQNSIYGSPFSDKFFGGLLSHSRNAGNVVRGISKLIFLGLSPFLYAVAVAIPLFGGLPTYPPTLHAISLLW